MAISRHVKIFGLAWYLNRPDDPAATRGDLDLTPQLYRLVWQWQRDIECRTIHTTAQRFSLARMSRFYNHHWLLASFSRRGIVEVQRIVAQYRRDGLTPPSQPIPAIRTKLLAELHSDVDHLLQGNGELTQTQIKSAMIDQACRDQRGGTRRHGDDCPILREEPEQDPAETNLADLLTQKPTRESSPVASELPPGAICVLLSEPQVKPRDELSAIVTNLKKPKLLAGAADVNAIDIFYAQLFEESPWLQPVIEWMWRTHRDLLNEPLTYFRLPPVLLVGPPGCGKTHLLERLADLSGVTRRRLDMSGISSGFAITGVESGWSSSRPGEPVCAIADGEVANPLIILDEIEKSRANSGAADPLLGLLPLLQRDSAARFRCPALRAEIDLSHITWAMTGNELGRLPAPLLDRITVFHCAAPSGAHLRHHVQRRLGRYAADPSVIDRVVQEIEAGRLSLRGLGRIEAAFRRLDRGGPLLN